MRNTGIVLRTTIKRAKLYLLIAIAGGLLLCGMHMMPWGSLEVIAIGLIDQDGSAVSKDLVRYLEKDLDMDVIESANVDFDESLSDMKTKIVDKKVSAMIIVPKGYEESIVDLGNIHSSGKERELEIIMSDDYANAEFTRAYIESYVTSLKTMAIAAEGDSNTLTDMIHETNLLSKDMIQTASSHDDVAQFTNNEIFKSIFGFFMMMGIMQSIILANMIYDDRVKGQYNRLRSTALKPASYVAGISIFGTLGCCLMSFIYLTFLQISGNLPDIDIVEVYVLCGIFALFLVGAAMVCGLYFNSLGAIMAGIIGIGTVASMLGGTYFPISSSPIFMQRIAHFIPQYWFMDAIIASIDAGGKSTPWAINALIILLYAALFFIVTGIKYAHQSSTSRRLGSGVRALVSQES
ncbi:MAG: ABC transporter permease [Clostridiales Family XIII bacterium]|jgi:ABC-2 type transport system permease protein|nr:ABC transporter permease [Clostridiales Family XIII bacterium]